MGLVDRLKSYLNEEDTSEPVSEREPADGRVRLQAIDEEKDGVSLSLSEDGIKKQQRNTTKARPKTAAKRPVGQKQSQEKGMSIGERARARNIKFVDETGNTETKDKKKTGTRDISVSAGDSVVEIREKKADNNSDKKKSRREARQHRKAVKRLAKAIKNSRRAYQEEEEISPEEARTQTVKDFCEQLIDLKGHMEELKTEYKLVSSYLMDIQRIDELPVQYAEEIIQLAQDVDTLDKNRETYIQSENLLPQEQYNALSQLEREVPGAIQKLGDMERRDTLLKNDMSHLEGEKEDLRYMRAEYEESIDWIRGIVITVFVLCILTLGVITAIAYMNKSTVTVYVLAVVAFVALVFAIGYARYVNIVTHIKRNDACLTRAISLLNKVKVKFINNTNTLDYVYDKYKVHSANELEYVWEQYKVMSRDRLRYTETNQELRRAIERLEKRLKSLGIQEPEVWARQIPAIIDRREMVEMRHGLNQRRQKLRESIAGCEKLSDNAITALRAAVAENPGAAELIKDMLKPHGIQVAGVV